MNTKQTRNYKKCTIYLKSICRLLLTKSYHSKCHPYDNAPMEHYFNTLKPELINQHYCHNDKELNNGIYDYAYVWYKHLRPHTFNNGLTPFEAKFNNN